MRVYTLGYGNRPKEEVLGLLLGAGVRAVVDVRLRPDRASMGIYTKAKTPDKGIERWLREAGLEYFSLVELGNVFLDLPAWRTRYEELLDRAGDLLAARLEEVPTPYCLFCAEMDPTLCHREVIAKYLLGRGHVITHLG